MSIRLSGKGKADETRQYSKAKNDLIFSIQRYTKRPTVLFYAVALHLEHLERCTQRKNCTEEGGAEQKTCDETACSTVAPWSLCVELQNGGHTTRRIAQRRRTVWNLAAVAVTTLRRKYQLSLA